MKYSEKNYNKWLAQESAKEEQEFAEPLNVSPIHTVCLGDNEDDCLKVSLYNDFTLIENFLSDFNECPILSMKCFSNYVVNYTLCDGSQRTMVLKQGARLKTPEEIWAHCIIKTANEYLEKNSPNVNKTFL